MVSVSVVMPVFNSEDYLHAAIQSVIDQTYDDWELLIVDDSSTDASAQIAQNLARDDDRIHLISTTRNAGAAACRNLATDHAKGRYIAFLDSDDHWLPTKLEEQVSFMTTNGCALSCTAYSRVDELGHTIQVSHVPPRMDYDALLLRNRIGCLTAIYDSSKVGKFYMPELNRQHDYAMWLEIVRQTGPALGLDKILAIYSERSGSLSGNKLLTSMDMWRVYRHHQDLSLSRSSVCFASYFWNGIKYRILRPAVDGDA